MRQHRLRHLRVLRLRKTDYTAGHLLAATTAMRHWAGGEPRDDGFTYSFEERHHEHHRHRSRSRRDDNRNSDASRTVGACKRGGGKSSLRSSSRTAYPSSSSAVPSWSPSSSPNRARNLRPSGKKYGGSCGRGRGVRSAPRLASLLDADDIYGGGNILSSPDLEECLRATRKFSTNAGGGGSDGDGNGREETGSLASTTSNSVGSNYSLGVNGSVLAGSGGRGSHRKTVGATRSGHKPSRKRGGNEKEAGSRTSGSGRVGNGSTAGICGTDGSVDSQSHPEGSCFSSGEDVGFTADAKGRYSQRLKGEMGGRGGKRNGRAYSSLGGDNQEGADMGMLFNPFAFPDEKEGVRVLIQATKPLEVGTCCMWVHLVEVSSAMHGRIMRKYVW